MRWSRIESPLIIRSGGDSVRSTRKCGRPHAPPPAAARTSSAANARPPGTSCKHDMLALELERLGREVEAGPQIVAFQIGRLLQEVLERVASGQIFEHGLDRIAQMPN